MQDSLPTQNDLENSSLIEETEFTTAPSPPMPEFEAKKLNEKRWKELTKGLRYDDFDQPEKAREPMNLPNLNFLSALGPVAKYVFIILILGLIIFFVVRLVVNFKPKPADLLEELGYEMDAQGMQLPVSELDQLIASAVANQQFTMALKLYYLKSLRMLDLKNHISWERHKTNSSYLRECKHKDFLPAFQKITSVYEKYWYGDQHVLPANFDQIKDLFTAFYQKIH